jgi:hypothetical protein
MIPPRPARHKPPGPADPWPPRGRGRPGNYGTYRAERLAGNVGYLDLGGVAGPEDAGTGETRQFWSLAYLPGSRYLDRPVYLLTSRKTFSGGEDFCYILQAQGRAQVIGETTGGGAHPARMVPITSTMAISVPFARSVNPVTGTNWQGTGVVPDIAGPAAEAYDVAYGNALRHVLSTTVPRPSRRGSRGPCRTASHRPGLAALQPWRGSPALWPRAVPRPACLSQPWETGAGGCDGGNAGNCRCRDAGQGRVPAAAGGRGQGSGGRCGTQPGQPGHRVPQRSTSQHRSR